MSLRVVVIAATKAEGREFARTMHEDRELVAIVTPRSPDAARGIAADDVLRTPAMHWHPRIAELLAAVKPCMATSTWRREFPGEWVDPEPTDPTSVAERFPPAPVGYVACRVMLRNATLTHLVELDEKGSNGGRPTVCGLTRFADVDADGNYIPGTAGLPGWGMGDSGVTGPGVEQIKCAGCYSGAAPASTDSTISTECAGDRHGTCSCASWHYCPGGDDCEGGCKATAPKPQVSGSE